jgi:hypothetical protein
MAIISPVRVSPFCSSSKRQSEAWKIDDHQKEDRAQSLISIDGRLCTGYRGSSETRPRTTKCLIIVHGRVVPQN